MPVRSVRRRDTKRHLRRFPRLRTPRRCRLRSFPRRSWRCPIPRAWRATAIAEDVYNAISAGQKSGDAVNFVANSTKLAKAGFAETSQTLDVLTTILNAYGMSADKVGTVSDMLVQIQNKGKVTVGELSSVMGKIIPTANSYNVSAGTVGATYAIMTSKGIALRRNYYLRQLYAERTGQERHHRRQDTAKGSRRRLF